VRQVDLLTGRKISTTEGFKLKSAARRFQFRRNEHAILIGRTDGEFVRLCEEMCRNSAANLVVFPPTIDILAEYMLAPLALNERARCILDRPSIERFYIFEVRYNSYSS